MFMEKPESGAVFAFFQVGKEIAFSSTQLWTVCTI